jgi:nucleotide-binding universal stress UspA family protein
VLGYHRHGMLYQLLFGGVDEDVVHQAPCPVMVVPPAGNADA